MTYTVYGLSEWVGGPIRYIGVTGGPIEGRVTSHLAKARRAAVPSLFQAWLLACGRPATRPLGVVEGVVEAQAAEKKAIGDALADGAGLFNRSRGGTIHQGTGYSVARREQQSVASRKAWAARRVQIVAAQCAGKARPDARARSSAAMCQVWERPGMRKHQSLAHATRLTEDDVRDIKRRIEAGESNTTIAQRFNIAPCNISSIRVGRIWRHITIQAA